MVKEYRRVQLPNEIRRIRQLRSGINLYARPGACGAFSQIFSERENTTTDKPIAETTLPNEAVLESRSQLMDQQLRSLEY
jgi:hypothetical protein